MRVKPLLVVSCLAAAIRPATAEPCAQPAAAKERVTLGGIDAAGDLQLADGRTLRLIGLAPRQDETEDARFKVAVEPFLSRQVELDVSGAQDRWGRWPARITLVPDGREPGAGGDLAALLRQVGAARPLPEAVAGSCSEAPSGQENATTVKAPTEALDGHDLAALKAQEGRYVMLEGRIASVGERAQRTYLNFSRRPKEAAAIVVSRKLWRELQAAGWTAGTLGGKRLRAHGVLGGRDGLLLDVTSRAALELID